MSVGPQNPFSAQLHAEKYREPNESFRDGMSRIAGALKDSDKHFHEFRDILLDMRFMPGGRIQAAMGASKRVTAYNCFVSPTISDSFVDGDRSIMRVAAKAAQTMRMGGGIGYDFSTLRPQGALIKKLASQSSGPLGFMPIYDAVCKTTASAGNRRGAQMGVLRIDHPDVLKFIRAKQPSPEVQVLWDIVEEMPDSPQRAAAVMALQETLDLTGFNVSVAVTDEFMKALERGSSYKLRFGGRIQGELDAQTVWESLMRSTWDWAEPGVLFIDTINKRNPLYYCEKIAATNPCVTGDTPILTKQGWIPIEKRVGVPVEIWNGFEWSKVTPKITGRNQKMMKVTLSNGRDLTCTRYHKFVLRNGSRVEAQQLRTGDQLIKTDWPVIDGFIELPNAYQQGFFSGDGWVRSRDSRQYIALYGTKKELEHCFDGFTSRGEYAIRGGYEGTNLSETRVYLSYDANTFKDKQFVPDASYTVASRVDWLAGLMDADGTVLVKHHTKSVQIGSINRDFLLAVQMMLNTVGVSSSVVPMKGDCYRILITGWALSKLEDLGLLPVRLNLEGNNPEQDASRYPTIINIVDVGTEETVYCFDEPLKHTGAFNGVVTAQCGEQPLPPNGACLLGSFNLARYIRIDADGHYYFDWYQFEEDIPAVVRAMDNVIDRTIYPLHEQEQEALSKRRMGLGVTGLANAGETLGYPYGSPEFVKFETLVLAILRDGAYQASASLAAEKGSFPLYDQDRYAKGWFYQTLESETKALIAKHGLRNSHLLSIAPTGTISLAADNVSSSIEPVFAVETSRKVKLVSGDTTVDVKDYAFEQFNTVPRTADQVSVNEHLDVLLTAANRVDSAVSKTCNVSPDTPWDDFKNVYVRAWEGGAKGCTTFNIAGKRMGIMTAKPTVEKEQTCEIDLATGRRSCE